MGPWGVWSGGGGGLARKAATVKEWADSPFRGAGLYMRCGVARRIRMNPGESALDLAAKRLERAVHVLEQRLAQRLKQAGAEAGGLFDQDRALLAAELDRAKARERELAEAGAEASAALGRAIVEIRAALNGQAAAEEI
jgi:hypothetical protein